MEAVVLLGILFFAAIGGLVAYILCTPAQGVQPAALIPFTLLPVTDASPSTKAFLELYAAQVAWMDSSVLRCVILVHPDGREESARLCAELARQYEFFTCMSESQVRRLLSQRLGQAESGEKNSEISCILSQNIV